MISDTKNDLDNLNLTTTPKCHTIAPNNVLQRCARVKSEAVTEIETQTFTFMHSMNGAVMARAALALY